MDYTTDGLRDAHFKGFFPLNTLTRSQVLGSRGTPDIEGVYIIIRQAAGRPHFIEDDHPKPRPPIMPTSEIEALWAAENPAILYIGKAPLRGLAGNRRNGLANRLLEFQNTGFKGATNHFGGRLIWRISDRDKLLVCWKRFPEGTSADIESLMINGFKAAHGQPPFANLGQPKRNPERSLLSLIHSVECDSPMKRR